MAAQGPPIYWVAAHRKHHKNSDLPDDPHSPYHLQGNFAIYRGFLYAHFGWMIHDQNISYFRYAPDIARDKHLARVSGFYWYWVALGLLLPGCLSAAYSQSWMGFVTGVAFCGLARICLSHHVTWSVNSLTHLIGTREYPTLDHSTNLAFLAIPTLGESWHNNHHAFPTSARHGMKWWQLDLTYSAIRFLSFLGLAWDIKYPATNELSDTHIG